MHDNDDPVDIDIHRLSKALQGGSIRPPSGLCRSERRKWIRDNGGKAGPLLTDEQMSAASKDFMDYLKRMSHDNA